MNSELLKERLNAVSKQKPEWKLPILEVRNWLHEADPVSKHRINPYNIVSAVEGRFESILGILLYGVKESVFRLHWDIHCPHCNMITSEVDSLLNASGSSHCNMCEVDFIADFSSRVEVTFSLHPEIENINLPAFCIPPKNMEVFAGLNLPPGEKAEADLELVPGKYRYFCPITVTKGVLTVEGDVTDAVQEMTIHQLEESRYDHPFYRLRPGKIHLKAINDTNSLSGVFLTKNELSEELSPDDFGLRLSGLELTHFPVFRELFGSETLSERERMTISGVTILFTDIKGSTKMYEDLGDIPAYNIVRDHFDILIDVIKNNGGYVIKTIGDAVMASFMRSDDSIKSVYEVFEEFDKYNESKGSNEKVSLKIGVHSGPAILVNLNDRIDYFGTTVNKAARIQSLSNSENFCVSEEIFGQPEIKELLKQNGVKRVNRKFRELKGLSGKHPVYFIPIGK